MQSISPSLRGTAVGVFFGILPGTGASISTFVSYALEKRVARDPSRFGKGAIEGVASPESANNAAAQCSFIPTLTLGIPGSGVMALLITILMIHGITPGPTLMTTRADLFWGLIASMWVGNVILLILNIPLISIWIQMLKIPYRLLFPIIVAFVCVGTFSVGTDTFHLYFLVGVLLAGFLWRKLECPPVTLILGFVLGPLLEENFRRALLISRGDPTVFFTRPISCAFLIATVALLLIGVFMSYKGKKKLLAEEPES